MTRFCMMNYALRFSLKSWLEKSWNAYKMSNVLDNSVLIFY